jgi:hypothetical protein
MKGNALEGRVDGGLFRKYTKHFPKRMGKDTKSLLSDMKVSWYKFQPGTPEYKQEASELQ